MSSCLNRTVICNKLLPNKRTSNLLLYVTGCVGVLDVFGSRLIYWVCLVTGWYTRCV